MSSPRKQLPGNWPDARQMEAGIDLYQAPELQGRILSVQDKCRNGNRRD
ncbi:hypothetical protein GRAN_1767 [Granulicella sibirica]|uniref:Uncharacterized protein n=1 Tax=Granulicella sibirica TaxID=2479048 RepID=A0A4Q0T513_9BACT|nr:hypothetical protein GRAN_1767 [Granulicella sibirica]